MMKESALRKRGETEKARSVYSFDQPSEILKNTMRTRLTLQPHQDGAKQLLAEYGERLVCVRYRYDERRKRRLKTVELIVEESDWEPRAAACPDERLVHIKVSLPEADLQRRVKAAGGRWDRHRQAWEIRYDQVRALGLTGRIVDG